MQNPTAGSQVFDEAVEAKRKDMVKENFMRAWALTLELLGPRKALRICAEATIAARAKVGPDRAKLIEVWLETPERTVRSWRRHC